MLASPDSRELLFELDIEAVDVAVRENVANRGRVRAGSIGERDVRRHERLKQEIKDAFAAFG